MFHVLVEGIFHDTKRQSPFKTFIVITRLNYSKEYEVLRKENPLLGCKTFLIVLGDSAYLVSQVQLVVLNISPALMSYGNVFIDGQRR